MRNRRDSRTDAVSESDPGSPRVRGPTGTGRLARAASRLGAVVVGVVALSTTASAHGRAEVGGLPVGFVVVVALPVGAGLLGGHLAIRYRLAGHRAEGRNRGRLAVGVLVLVLGVTMVFTASTMDLAIASIGGTGGALAAAVATVGPNASARGSSKHAHLTLGAIGAHRLLEGAIVGGLYGIDAVVGLVGALVIAGHTALETAAAGGLYSTRRRRASAAVVFVQLCYVAGAGTGGLLAVSLSESVRVGTLALVGGVLCSSGVAETRRWLVAPERRSAHGRRDVD